MESNQGGRMIINTEYVKSTEGILKFMEIIAIFAAFSCLGDFDRDVTIWGNRYQVRYNIFMGAFIMGWIIVLFVFCVFLFSLESRIMIESNWNQVLFLFSLLFAVLFLVTSGVMADFLFNLYDRGWHKLQPNRKYTDVLTVSVFFGFLSGVLLVVDCFLAFRKVDR
ncbi:uncharacterized protein LOC114960804 isoform X2 [Acropora millepora]|uniref:uncharacterized protein LOC114960804 isoform X2 n=1 Tax=Acropora millepora TaxID=45264 RepID=UPI001CF0E8C2|nr:uncharacterized protein LOC114960804 isoform X2 [Acropora millepora]